MSICMMSAGSPKAKNGSRKTAPPKTNPLPQVGHHAVDPVCSFSRPVEVIVVHPAAG
jgi:hypothetical protein